MNNRLPYIDSLRGIAALMVVFSHYVERTPMHDFFIFDYFNAGKFGVAVFFIISGMVIPFSLREGDYAIRRFFYLPFF